MDLADLGADLPAGVFAHEVLAGETIYEEEVDVDVRELLEPRAGLADAGAGAKVFALGVRREEG